MAKHNESERKIRKIISNEEFVFQNENYTTSNAVKPEIDGSGGECKTDCYVIATRDSDKKEVEFKISYKQENSSFVENKIRKPTAGTIFGDNWSQIIKEQIDKIKDRFLAEPLFYKEKDRKTRKGSIKLGWRYEMEYRGTRPLGTPIQQNIAERVWTNKNGDEKYKNCSVNGKKIVNSGVPNFFLQKNASKINSIDDLISNLIPIDEIIKNGSITAAFTAQNYNPYSKKQHGGTKRHLSVPIDWYVKNGKISAKLNFDNPLEFNSNEQEEKLLTVLKEFDIEIGSKFSVEKFHENLDSDVVIFLKE